ncbi:hypothetical protein EDD37DRAFT_692390 [Exophiala viscosa]|uniref:Uncharacterized protein n=1 Tax=Exophiala viscosa TaxID=2486360 RepID=A0AAN6E952_9EURO|nr:hypothetical protein EDD36DRAFT_492343 [Exophiala viscosa]KAI1628126.1 hypothetical protein EDD37DRAFT_692390 [Exophiala viscosa]
MAPPDPRINRISYARMVQPALPALPGLGKQPPSKKKAPPQNESEKVGTTSAPPTAAQEDTRDKVESEVIASPETAPTTASLDGPDDNEGNVVLTGSPPTSDDQVATTAPEEITSNQAVNQSSTEENELAVPDPKVTADDKSNLPASDFTGQEGTKDEVTTSIENASHETVKSDQGDIQYPAWSSPAPSATAGDEHQQHTSESKELIDQIPVVYESAISPSPFTPTDNGTHSSEQARSQSRATQGSGPTDTSEPIVTNGYHHRAMTATSSRRPSSPAPPARMLTALIPLHEHLLLLAHTKEGVDYAIQVNPPGVQPFVAYSHSTMMLRSPRLRKLMQSVQSLPNNSYVGNLINLYPASYMVSHAFEAALRFLYSDTVLSNDFFLQAQPGPDFHASRLHNLDYILSYWVAGIELGTEQVCVCAERLLSNFLDWDIIEITYKHALDFGKSPVVTSGKNMTGAEYLIASNTIIRMILRFLAARMNIGSFKLNVDSVSIHFAPRLPQLDDGRPRHNPTLASMVFGSMPSSAGMSTASPSPQSEIIPNHTTFRDTVASNILLNLDFEHLCFFKSAVRTENSVDDKVFNPILAAIVNERESRRLRVFNARSFSTKDRMANQTAWDPVGWREYVEEDGWIHRDRVGYLHRPQSK